MSHSEPVGSLSHYEVQSLGYLRHFFRAENVYAKTLISNTHFYFSVSLNNGGI